MSARRTALLVATLVSASALGGPMRIALHPLLVVGGEGSETASLQALFATQVIALGDDPVPSDEVDHWLAAHGGRCDTDSCLAALARAIGAARALRVSISPYSPRVIFSGRLVSQSGSVVANIDSKSFPRRDSLADDFHRFLRALDLDAPEPVPLVAPHPPVVAQPPAVSHPVAAPVLVPKPTAPSVAEPLPAVDSHRTLRLTSYLVAGAGAAALVIAGGVAVSAKSDHNKLDALLDSSGARPPTQEAKDLDASLTSRSHLVNALLVGGSAAAIGGAVLWWFSRPSPVRVTLAPSGTGLAVAGSF